MELQPNPSDFAQKMWGFIIALLLYYNCVLTPFSQNKCGFTKVVVEGELVIVPNLKD